MHQRRPLTSTTTTAANGNGTGAPAPLVDDGAGHTTTNNATTTKQPKRTRRRRRARPQDNGGDVQCLMILVAVVSLFLLVALFIVVKLWRESGMLHPKELWLQGSRFKEPAQQSQQSQQQSQQQQQEAEFPELPPNPIYTVPHSMAHIGDRSDAYANLRKTVDAQLPYDPERSLQAQERIRNSEPNHNFSTFAHDIPYDIYNCPETPPPGYPYEWKTLDVLQHWSPENVTVPSTIHQGLCVFDYRKDYIKALVYRNAELPFVVTGDPDVAAAVERWNYPGYLDILLGQDHVEHRAEWSQSNHFMYWVPGNAQRPSGRTAGNNNPVEPEGWHPPTKMMRLTYPEFMARATAPVTNDQAHWYFRLIGCGETGPTGNCDAGTSEWLFDELTFFQPRPNLLYLGEPSFQRGIHCRFGMTGVTIANHFDSSRNAIVLLGGQRRYILSHPKHCANLALYPKGHPSARHSAIDWSRPDLENYPDFANAKSNEVALQAGDVLYLPTNWFHYIVSLGLNYQCNTRSGTSQEYMPPIRDCGF